MFLIRNRNNFYLFRTPRRLYVYVISYILFLLCFKIALLPADENTIKHYGHGFTPNLRIYTEDYLRLIANESKHRFGPYNFVVYSKPLSPNRSMKKAERGDEINVLFKSFWDGEYVNEDEMERMDIPVFFGMLGLRSVIAKPESLAQINSIRSLQQLRKFSAGFGARWVDSEVFRHNNLNVVEANNYRNLFPMLTNGRFDYIPLGQLEAKQAVTENQQFYFDFVIVESPKIFYPMPVYLYVSKNANGLYKRLNYGAQRAIKNGKMENLFRQHFKADLPQSSEKDAKVPLILLSNPRFSKNKNQVFTKNFLEMYGHHFIPIDK